MLDCIDWNKSGTPYKRDQRVNMVTEWGRKNYKEDAKKLQIDEQETHFIEDRRSSFDRTFLL
jgi:hypothetical protein